MGAVGEDHFGGTRGMVWEVGGEGPQDPLNRCVRAKTGGNWGEIFFLGKAKSKQNESFNIACDGGKFISAFSSIFSV